MNSTDWRSLTLSEPLRAAGSQAADGGTVDLLAGRRRLSAGALPRVQAQSRVAVGPGRGAEPAPAAHPGFDLAGWGLGAGLTGQARPHPAERDPGHRKPVGCANADMASKLAVRSTTP